MIWLLWLLNLFDAWSTYVLTRAGLAYELNPIMRFLLSKGPWAFFGLKVGLLTLVCLAQTRIIDPVRRKSMSRVLFWLVLLYSFILITHLKAWWLVYKYGGH